VGNKKLPVIEITLRASDAYSSTTMV
jgi:hypothetical protein